MSSTTPCPDCGLPAAVRVDRGDIVADCPACNALIAIDPDVLTEFGPDVQGDGAED